MREKLAREAHESSRSPDNRSRFQIINGEFEVQAVFAMNCLAWCARGSCKNVLSEARDLRRSLRDSMDHVTGGFFRAKSKPGWSWWYSPRDPKEAPQAAKNPRILSGAPKLPRKAG